MTRFASTAAQRDTSPTKGSPNGAIPSANAFLRIEGWSRGNTPTPRHSIGVDAAV